MPLPRASGGDAPTRRPLEEALGGRPHPPVEGAGSTGGRDAVPARAGRPAAAPASEPRRSLVRPRQPAGRALRSRGRCGLLGTALRETREEVGVRSARARPACSARSASTWARTRDHRRSASRSSWQRSTSGHRLSCRPRSPRRYWVPLTQLVPGKVRRARAARRGARRTRSSSTASCLVVWGITYAILEILRATCREA